ADISTGLVLINGTHQAVAADKSGNFYLMDGDAMGRPGAQNSNAFQIYQVSPGPIFNFAVWNRPGDARVYIQGSNDVLKCFRIVSSGFDSNPVSVASVPLPFSRIGMTLSANGAQDGTGILWEITGNYNTGAPGTLHAYDASNLASEVWNS